MGKHKAPGPDGLPVQFYQKFWPVVEEAVTEFLLDVFRTGKIPTEMNESLICFIPKQHQPETIMQFQPICLSNVVMKIISKVIANRLRLIMQKLVGLEQASFIPGRHTTDNIVVVQEAIQTLRRKKKENMVL